ncbi:10335_t:CDS:2 [Ambispora gerdemannii]|uniref:10335_t:CDS:1 n=1 Tax=Ambispora gerdemannii TaxID=144530 RepID=A0A9N9H6C4_9GLOM|nr:10335_t:CDS:2 [Ambispora gerdemannii]
MSAGGDEHAYYTSAHFPSFLLSLMTDDPVSRLPFPNTVSNVRQPRRFPTPQRHLE